MKQSNNDSRPVSLPKRKLKKNQYGITVYDYMVERYMVKNGLINKA